MFRWLVRLTGIALFLLLLLVAFAVGRGWERTVEDAAGVWVAVQARGRVVDSGSPGLETREWGIVLGASIHSPHFRERVTAAAELYRAGKVKKLLLSGDGRKASYDEPRAMRERLVKLGVPRRALVEDGWGLSTHASMRRAREVHGITEAWIVTQGYHAPRAVYLAGHSGIDARAYAAEMPVDGARDEARERKARVKAVLEAWGLEEVALRVMSRMSDELRQVAVMGGMGG